MRDLARWAVCAVLLSSACLPVRAETPRSQPGTATAAPLSSARRHLRDGRFGEAETALRRHLSLEPRSPEGLYLLAYVLFRQGRATDSLRAYQDAAAAQAPTADDWKIVGLNHGLLNQWDQARVGLERALALEADNLEARYYLGRVFFSLNRFAEAAATFREVLGRDPRHVKARNHLGQTLEALNDPDGALAAYRQAVALDQESSRPSEFPLLNLATLLLQRGDTAAALSLLEKAATISPTNAKVRFRLGSACSQLGRWVDAERHLTEAARLEPDDAATRYVLGRLYHRLGRPEQAQAELRASQQLRQGARP